MSGKLKSFFVKTITQVLCVVFLFFVSAQIYVAKANAKNNKHVKAKVKPKASSKKAKSKIVFTDPSKTIIVKKTKPTFRVVLQSNATTGYSWSLKNYDSGLIVPIGHRFYPPEDKKLLGAPGYEKWTFKVKPRAFTVPHTTSMNLIYARPGDAQGAKVINFRVVTKK